MLSVAFVNFVAESALIRDSHRGAAQTTSRFYPVAGDFLFPLLRNWDVNKKTLLLETNDRDILCRMISYVGLIILNLIWNIKLNEFTVM